jgi:hypothetical protein
MGRDKQQVAFILAAGWQNFDALMKQLKPVAPKMWSVNR